MGLFETIFKKPRVHTKGYFQMLDGYTPVYTSYNGAIYEQIQTKSIINTIASDCAKSIPTLQKKNKKYDYILRHKPNPYMTTTSFIERVVTNYLCDNNSFILPLLNEYDEIVGLFPISYNQVEALDCNGELYLKYSFNNGQEGVIEYSRVGHLKRMQYKNDIFGDSNSALHQTLEIMDSQNQSVNNALKQSGVIRFMAQLNEQMINTKDIETQRKNFADVNFKSDNNQMMIYDSRYKEIKQVESKPIFLDDKQQNLIDSNVHDYFGVSKNVIQHSFSEEEWNAYYEGVIEPILIKLGETITSMLYTKEQILNGNMVYFTTNRMQYMSNQSKLEFSSQLFDRGIICGNDICDVWNLPHYEGGEKHYIRREYAEIDKLDNDVNNQDEEKITLDEKDGEKNEER